VSRRAVIGGGAALAAMAGAAVAGAATRGPVELASATGRRRPPTTTTTTTTTATTTTVPPTTEAPTTVPETTTTTQPPVDRLAAFRGYGAWWDAYNWSPTFTAANNRPLTVSLADVNRLALSGVQTLYLQSGHNRAEPDVLDEPLQREIIAAAHGHGIRVVAWYVPVHLDQGRDLARLEAAVALGVDGVATDMEVDDEPDIALRNERLRWVSAEFAARHPEVPFAAITNPPVLYDEINLRWWPSFPYQQLVPHYDVWIPMAYWTQRKGVWRDAANYTRDSVLRLRLHTAVADLAVHVIGGLAHQASVGEVQAMGAVMRETGCVGGSLYDETVTGPGLREVLRAELTR
jgi:hypothetical protein